MKFYLTIVLFLSLIGTVLGAFLLEDYHFFADAIVTSSVTLLLSVLVFFLLGKKKANYWVLLVSIFTIFFLFVPLFQSIISHGLVTILLIVLCLIAITLLVPSQFEGISLPAFTCTKLLILFISNAALVVLFQMIFPFRQWTAPIVAATNEWITTTMLFALLILVANTLLLGLFSKRNILVVLKETGILDRRKFLKGVVIFLVALGFILIFQSIYIVRFGGSLGISMTTIQVIIEQVFGVGLFEEMLFRFIFLVGVLASISKYSSVAERTKLILAIFISQIGFSIIHIPMMLTGGYPFNLYSVNVLFHYVLIGIVFALLFILTNNIWIPIFIHGLNNTLAWTSMNTSVINYTSLLFLYTVIIVLLMKQKQVEGG